MNKNIGKTDGFVRFIAGAGLISWALSGGPVWAWVGAILLIGSLIGICPLYALLGISTCGRCDLTDSDEGKVSEEDATYYLDEDDEPGCCGKETPCCGEGGVEEDSKSTCCATENDPKETSCSVEDNSKDEDKECCDKSESSCCDSTSDESNGCDKADKEDKKDCC